MTHSSPRPDNPELVKARFDAACAEIRERISGRRARCEAIAYKARRFRLDVDVDKVSRHYEWFVRWDEGNIATGYLMKRTGVRRIATRDTKG